MNRIGCFERGRRTIAAALIAGTLGYIAWRATFTLNVEHPIASGLLLLADCIAAFSTIGFALSVYHLSKVPTGSSPAEGLRVDVWIPTYNESVDILEKTIYHCVKMDYPHRTYVLDDGNRPHIKELAERLGALYIKRENNIHAKAGNLNNALKHTDGDFIAIFDADFIPQRDFLTELLGFFNDSKMAIVQSPQQYYNLNSFQFQNSTIWRKPWHEQQSFFDLILPGRNHWNAAFWIGTNAIIRRKAVESIGGFATDSVIEDMLTSIYIHAKKWRSVYVNKPLAHGLAPSNLSHFLSQRLRWSKGAAQILRQHNPLFVKGLSLIQRLLYLTSIFHFFDGTARLIFYTLPAVYLLTDISPLKVDRATIDIILGYILFGYISMYVISKGAVSVLYDEIYAAVRFFTYFCGNLFFLVKRPLKFIVTPKDDCEATPWFFLVGLMVVFGINVAAIISKGFLFAYAEMVSLNFVVGMFFCTCFAAVSLKALSLCFSSTRSVSSQIHDFVFVDVSSDETDSAGDTTCLVRAWDDASARILSQRSLAVGSRLLLNARTEDGTVLRGVRACVTGVRKFCRIGGEAVHEYEVKYEDVKDLERLKLVNHIFHKGVRRQSEQLRKSRKAVAFPAIVDHGGEFVTMGKYVCRNRLLLAVPEDLPKGTVVQIRLPYKKACSVTVVDSFKEDNSAYVVAAVNEEAGVFHWWKMNRGPSLLPRRQVRMAKFTLATILLVVAANYSGDFVSARKGLFDTYDISFSSASLSDFIQSHFFPTRDSPAKGCATPSSDVVRRYGNLQVRDGGLRAEDGSPVQLRGISSHGIHWYPFARGRTLRNIVQCFNADVVRVAMYVEAFKDEKFWNGYIAQPQYMTAQADKIIQDAVNEGVYVILSWHIHNNPLKYLKEARTFFATASQKWGRYPNVIFEICNEPEGAIPWSSIREYAVGNPTDPTDGIIDVIRQNDSDANPNLVIVGTPFWSQRVDEALESPITEHGTVMYALHFYASEHKEEIRQHAQRAIDGGLPVFVSEWGTCNYGANGPSDYDSSDAWVQWMNQNKISWVNWSLSTKDESPSLLKPTTSMVGPWTDQDLTCSGRYIKSLLAEKEPSTDLAFRPTDIRDVARTERQ